MFINQFCNIYLEMKKFDLEEARAGKPVCLRDGRPARIICFDAEGDFPIIALVLERSFYTCNREYPESYTNKGKFSAKDRDESDLMMVTDKKEGYVNLFGFNDQREVTGMIYNSKTEAMDAAKEVGLRYMGAVKIEWEE